MGYLPQHLGAPKTMIGQAHL
ncbi:uncharacterized protein G2W53_033716 [Senna tora]|uniref:Uncharacterized protein n=1 Tax=Senna tora TaxID=362788 RepID=A0A834SYY0_9FABA|nr:uncharacterized protein G2W53_033716 [Senna tora]